MVKNSMVTMRGLSVEENRVLKKDKEPCFLSALKNDNGNR